MCYSALVKQSAKALGIEFGVEVRTGFDAFAEYERRPNKKLFPKLEERIFPGSYAAVIANDSEGRIVLPMRYGAYPPPGISDKAYTTFNARRDNLTSPFWKFAFKKHHGFVVLKAFYEWVSVQDLLRAKVVKLADIEAEFTRMAAERKAKVEAAGKKYKPTPTELKDPRFRQIIIEFRPEDGKEYAVPVIFSHRKVEGIDDWGFAIITDEPPPFVSDAGHDRCPVFLDRAYLDQWLDVESDVDFVKLLGKQSIPTLVHALPPAVA